MSGTAVSRRPRLAVALSLAISIALPAAALAADSEVDDGTAGPTEQTAPPSSSQTPVTTPGMRNGLEIYRNFREGLAQPECEPDASTRWRQHFAHAPKQLATPGNDVLPLFGYVVDALRAEHLPTEYALIPFVESGYRAGARSPSGPAGLWQFIAITARNHKVPVGASYDGRLSPVDSTRAAVRYLKTLHGMFAGDWRLAVMAYNAGEYRVLGALRRGGQLPASAEPEKLALPAITHAYVRKLHALACLLEEAEDRESWLDALDREVPILAAVPIPSGTGTLDRYAQRTGADPARLRRLNPAFADSLAHAPRDGMLLAPVGNMPASLIAANTPAPPPTPTSGGFLNQAPRDDIAPPPPSGRTHTVARGESPWVIARRYGIRVDELLSRNQLAESSVLRPGMRLRIDADATGDGAAGVAE